MISLPYVGAGGKGMLYHIVVISKTAVGPRRLIITLDSGLRRNDGWDAGMTGWKELRLGRRNDGWGAPRLITTLDSGLRRNDGWGVGMVVGMTE